MNFLFKGFYVKHVTSNIFCFCISKEMERAWRVWHTGGWFTISYLPKPHLKFFYCCFITRQDFSPSCPLLLPQNANAQSSGKSFCCCCCCCWVKFIFFPLMYSQLVPRHSDALLRSAHFPSCFSVSKACLKKRPDSSLVKESHGLQHPGVSSCSKEVSGLGFFLGLLWRNSPWVATRL